MLDAARRAAQQAFIASGRDLEIGQAQGLPWSPSELQRLATDDPRVSRVCDGGLTAQVLRLEGPRGPLALKRVRAESRVRNADGELSFLNEVMRRGDIERLRHAQPQQPRWCGLIETTYASYRQGLIVSPWIDGSPVSDWSERSIGQVLDSLCLLWGQGLFEWDLAPGNLLDTGRQVMLFDFGYMYPFDPRCQFNSAGRGDDQPLFHPAERFETRCFSAVLLDHARDAGDAAALTLFRLEKEVAMVAYERMRSEAAQRGANASVLGWLDGVLTGWRAALRGDLAGLFLAEQWRSHMIDVHDDLSGQSCTPLTLHRLDWLEDAARRHHGELQARGAFFWGDEHRSDAELRRRLAELRVHAERWQLGPRTPAPA
ncbi:MAG: hypothetical protein ACK4ZD_03910 [Caldimonas sp.]|jgi:hypothetical protein|uniref:hypothetical protein n=1 Tax=Caldimonas sp. TaxID=2838790 RepID=UPI00391CDC5F